MLLLSPEMDPDMTAVPWLGVPVLIGESILVKSDLPVSASHNRSIRALAVGKSKETLSLANSCLASSNRQEVGLQVCGVGTPNTLNPDLQLLSHLTCNIRTGGDALVVAK